MMDNTPLKKVQKFFSKFQSLKYKKGEIISRAGDPIFGIYFLKSGLARQYLISPQGQELTVRLFKPGYFFPLLLALTNLPNRYYFEAFSDVWVYRAPTNKVIGFIKNEPSVSFDFINRLSNTVYEIITRFENLMTEHAYERIVSLFIYLAGYIGEGSGRSLRINLPLTHEDIASWAGINRETASRQIEKLMEKGLIKHVNHIFIINDIKKMEREII